MSEVSPLYRLNLCTYIYTVIYRLIYDLECLDVFIEERTKDVKEILL